MGVWASRGEARAGVCAAADKAGLAMGRPWGPRCLGHDVCGPCRRVPGVPGAPGPAVMGRSPRAASGMWEVLHDASSGAARKAQKPVSAAASDQSL